MYFQTYEKPLSAIPEALISIGQLVSNLLMSLSEEFMKFGYMTADQLRKDALLQITTSAKSIPPDDIVSLLDEVELWLIA